MAQEDDWEVKSVESLAADFVAIPPVGETGIFIHKRDFTNTKVISRKRKQMMKSWT